MSQNELGRRTAMDGATIKGVVDRLRTRDLVATRPDPGDARRHLVELTDNGRDVANRSLARAFGITEKSLEPEVRALPFIDWLRNFGLRRVGFDLAW